MSLNHLSDKELQAYVDGQLVENRSTIENHLLQCDRCRMQLAAYQKISSTFRYEPEEIFSAEFENIIIDKIQQTASQKYPIKDRLYWFLSIILSFGILACYLLITQTGKYILGLVHGNLTWIKKTLFLVFETLEYLDMRLELIITVGMIFLLFSISDWILLLLRYKKVLYQNKSGL